MVTESLLPWFPPRFTLEERKQGLLNNHPVVTEEKKGFLGQSYRLELAKTAQSHDVTAPI